MTLARTIWNNIRSRWPLPVAIYKFPLTYLLCSIIYGIRVFLAWLNAMDEMSLEGGKSS